MEVIHKFGNIQYKEMDKVYPVSEDTLFLLGSVKRLLEKDDGRIMDMGCGVGLITLFASSLGWEVISVDREPLALENLRSNLAMNKLSSDLYLSDLFEGIPRKYEGSFDTISFNPPYLPHENIPIDRRADMALVGGENGHEVAEKFIRASSDFLKVGGRVIMLAYSSWVKKIDIGSIGSMIPNVKFKEKEIDGERFMIMELVKK